MVTADGAATLQDEFHRRRRAGIDGRWLGRDALLDETLIKIYPGLAGIEAEYAWEGLFAMTPDSLPYIGPHRRYPRHLFALGYGGNDMTFGVLASRLLLDWYRAKRTSDHELFAFSR